jgi:hypothetical protein
MKSYIKIILLAILFPVIFCIGCAGTPIKLGTIDQQFDRSKIDFTRPRYISASSSGCQLLLWIPISINDRQESTYGKLMAQAGSDYVTDFKIKESWTYIFIGTLYTTEIVATAYPRKN